MLRMTAAPFPTVTHTLPHSLPKSQGKGPVRDVPIMLRMTAFAGAEEGDDNGVPGDDGASM